ncbi:cytochrome P450 CYP749A22-like [Cucurbita moschata]|uniref:Cytochrome P450 CYP749A22-like n=1 Tax=Cucurbita moschata TaxID=3662 RepID=A0A6J1G0I3_CUCMO|nr:cytochrome P450 CYP749A22-like [Cucurbita moschata]
MESVSGYIIPSFVLGCVVCGGIIKVVAKLWWKPMRIQRMMRAQGIEGPSYNFIQGNMAEMYTKRMHAMATPMDLSHNILPRVLPHVYSWLNHYGKTFLQWYGMEAQLVITDPEMIKEVFHDRQKNYPKAKLDDHLLRIFGNGLVTSEGERWAKSRKIANYAFHGDSLKNMIPAMIECAATMIERWKLFEGKELDVLKELKVYTLDVISHTAFGSSYEQGKSIFQMLQDLSDLSIRNGYKIRVPVISKIFKSKDDVEGERLEKRMEEWFMEMIKSREEKFMNGEAEGYGNDFLGLLVKAKNDPENSHRISADVIVAECKTFYFAGHETTNVLIAWTMFLLAMHKEWQDEARNEVLEIFGTKNPSSEGLPKLRTMTMIINECLRLYPPAMTVSRQVEKEVRLGRLRLPATLQLTVPTIAVHHDKAFWGEDAHEFKPERFGEGVGKVMERNSAGYLPFGLGPRSCVGMSFAMNEAKIAMSMILQKYSLALSPAYAHMPAQFLTTCPQQGLHLILHSVSDHKA